MVEVVDEADKHQVVLDEVVEVVQEVTIHQIQQQAVRIDSVEVVEEYEMLQIQEVKPLVNDEIELLLFLTQQIEVIEFLLLQLVVQLQHLVEIQFIHSQRQELGQW